MSNYTEIREWLRKNAKQVKSFEIDQYFTGVIITHERTDKGQKGYEDTERKFNDFKDLKRFYSVGSPLNQEKNGTVEPVKGETATQRPRRGIGSSVKSIKDSVEKLIIKGRNK